VFWREGRSNGGVSNKEQSMQASRRIVGGWGSRRAITRVGYVSLVDAAPWFVALDLGMFARQGLKVVLQREVGWATIREKVLFGELEAAHALCPMPFAASIGLNSLEIPCVAGMVLSKGGNAIVLSEALWKRGARDGESLRKDIRNSRVFRKYIFATVYRTSTHAFLLRAWLRSARIDPDRDVQIVTLPPSQMVRNLAAGTIDGFCAGEPWPSLAIAEGIGWSPATSADIDPGHPEKVLMARESFAEERREEFIALVAALLEGCAYCDAPENREALVSMICEKGRVGCDEAILGSSLSPVFDYGMGRKEEKPGFMVFHANEANRPRQEDARWIIDGISGCEEGVIPEGSARGLAKRVFDDETYQAALHRIKHPVRSDFPLMR